MAKDFNKLGEDNPVMATLNAARELAAKQQNAKIEAVESEAATVVQTTVVPAKPVSEIKDEKRVLINILIRESTKKDWKLFFTEHDLNMTQGIEVAVGLLMSEVEKGTLRLSKGGITR